MNTCDNNCHSHTNGSNGFLIVLVIYILLAIIIYSNNRFI